MDYYVIFHTEYTESTQNAHRMLNVFSLTDFFMWDHYVDDKKGLSIEGDAHCPDRPDLNGPPAQQTVFVQIVKSICPNCQKYLSKLSKVFVQIVKYLYKL